MTGAEMYEEYRIFMREHHPDADICCIRTYQHVLEEMHISFRDRGKKIWSVILDDRIA